MHDAEEQRWLDGALSAYGTNGKSYRDKKVVCMTDPLSGSGRGRQILVVANTGDNILSRTAMLKDLLQRGWRVTAAASLDTGEAAQVGELGVQPIPLPIDSSGTNPVRDGRLFLALRRVYREIRPYAVHHFTIKPVIYGSLAAKRARIPRIINTITGLGYARDSWSTPLGRVIRLLYRQALRGGVFTVFQNEDDRRLMIESRLVTAEKSTIILGSGVDVERLIQRGTGPESPNFVMVSRMLWSKGVREFVEAASLVVDTHPDCKFAMIGGTSEEYASKNPDFVPRSWMEENVVDGVVEWIQHQPPDVVEDRMKRATAVVLPSFYGEGAPRALLEAAALGVPAITADSPGCRAVVVDGTTGLLCAPKDSRSLAEAMLRLLEDSALCMRFGQAARQRAIETFDQRLVFRSYQALYEG